MNDFTTSVPPFSERDQAGFGALSGDLNPIHMDAVAARRTMFGQTVVHGMHLMLRVLELLAQQGVVTAREKIAARFFKPVFLGEPTTVTVKINGEGFNIELSRDSTPLMALSLHGSAPPSPAAWSPSPDGLHMTPVDNSIQALENLSGTVALPYDEASLIAAFPAATALFGASIISHLLGVTRVIGMEAPGLRSLFASFAVVLKGGAGSNLDYKVTKTTPKISYAQLAFAGPVLDGVADVFVRPDARRPDLAAVASHVRSDEFAGRSHLILGGSRGLGLLTAYVLAIGGGEVTITYQAGQAEAEAAVAALAAAGISISAKRFDVTASNVDEQILRLNMNPDSLYYFPTRHIFNRRTVYFDPVLAEEFMSVYSVKFSEIVLGLKRLRSEPLHVFYPSSVILDEPMADLVEYSVGKSAGEATCRMLSLANPSLSMLVARLPRLETDQTMTMMAVKTVDTLPIILDICRRMNGASMENYRLVRY